MAGIVQPLSEQEATERARRMLPASFRNAAIELPQAGAVGAGAAGAPLPMTPEQQIRVDLAKSKAGLFGQEVKKGKLETGVLEEAAAVRKAAPQASAIANLVEAAKKLIEPRGILSTIWRLGGPNETAAVQLANNVESVVSQMSPEDREALGLIFRDPANPTTVFLQSAISAFAEAPGTIEFGSGQQIMRDALMKLRGLMQNSPVTAQPSPTMPQGSAPNPTGNSGGGGY